MHTQKNFKIEEMFRNGVIFLKNVEIVFKIKAGHPVKCSSNGEHTRILDRVNVHILADRKLQ